MTSEMNESERAMVLLEPGVAMDLARRMRIQHLHELSALQAVDLIGPLVRALRALERQNLQRAQKELTEVLAVLVAAPLGLNDALGFELLIREDSRKVRMLATQICRQEAEGHASVSADSDIEIQFEQDATFPPNDQETN